MTTKSSLHINRSGGQFLMTITKPGGEASGSLDAGKAGEFAPDFLQSLGDLSVSARLSPRSALYEDPNSQVCLIVHGELCHDGTDILDRKKQARNAHACYLQDGLDSLTQWLNGSFLVCVVDQQHSVIHLVTDRLGSKKAFLLEQERVVYIASSMHLLPDRPIDPVGATTYLNNAFNFSGRTVLDGVRSLERASVHSFSTQGHERRVYWHLSMSESSLMPPIEQARKELAELTRAAVRKRIPASGRIFISLSGGIDSRAILGCLLEAVTERDRIIAFSYGEANDGDVATAARLAEYAGIEHRMTGSCGDLCTTIRRNGNLGEGMVDFYTHGIDGLFQIENDFSENDVLFVGDTLAQGGCDGFLDLDEVLVRSMEIQSPAVVPGYYSFGDYDCETLHKRMEAELLEFKESLPDYKDIQDVHDYLFIDQRTSNMLLPWREFHAARFVTVANPLLDNAFLDFYCDLPTALRVDKSLHRETIPLMFPELCAIPIAKGGVNNRPIHHQLSTRRKALTSLIDDFDSRLDTLLPPELLGFALHDTAQNTALGNWPLPRPVRSIIRRLGRRFLKQRLMHNLTSHQRTAKPYLPLPALGAKQVERILALRYFLAETGTQ